MGLERVRLSARAVEREHLQSREVFPKRLPVDEALENREDRVVVPQRQAPPPPTLRDGDAQAGEP